MSVAAVLENAWYRGAWWLRLLIPLEWLFRALVGLRQWCYTRGWLAVYRPRVPVVVVGNITVGGTGKTPVVIALVEALRERGLCAGVISRGYGGRAGSYPHRVDDNSSAAQAGDEAWLIYRRTGAPCVVAPRRCEAARCLLAEESVDVLISDDGLQHYALARDFEIALMDGERGLGNGRCLPAGPLREPPARLGTVSRVLVRGGPEPGSAVTYQPGELCRLVDGERRAFVPARPGEQVHAVAGIGQPGQFFASVRAAGFHSIEHPFPDHYQFRAADFAGLDNAPLIMTEKDAVKCEGLTADNAWYLPISAILPADLVDEVVGLARAGC